MYRKFEIIFINVYICIPTVVNEKRDRVSYGELPLMSSRPCAIIYFIHVDLQWQLQRERQPAKFVYIYTPYNYFIQQYDNNSNNVSVNGWN